MELELKQARDALIANEARLMWLVLVENKPLTPA
jgi:hypothetical protein